MNLRLALLAVAGLAGSGTPGADAAAAQGTTCTRAAVGSAGIAVRTARAELMSVPLGDPDTMVDPAAGRRIEETKDRLRAFVRALMACAPSSAEPAALAAAMAQRGDASVDTVPYDPDRPAPDRHGNMLTYQVSRVEAHPDMLAVVATLGIKCGSDSMLILYRREEGRWRELMVRRSQPYSEVRGGWHDLRFAVSRADAQGNWFVATVSTTPWCTSAWQGLAYALARPDASPDRPNVFFHGKSTIYLGNESDLVLRAERGAFEIRHDGSSLDPEILVRRHVRRYAVAGESVRRVQPVAESVRDFVDEWVASPWAEASEWSAAGPALARTHKALHPDPLASLGRFVSIRGCGGAIAQVEVASVKGSSPRFFFVRNAEPGRFTMIRTAWDRDRICAGPDLLRRPPS